MANIADDERQKRFLTALPGDGSPLGNKTLRERLAWSIKTYQRVRGQLLEDGKVDVGRGRGGSVRRALDHQVSSVRAGTARTRRPAERDLYPRFQENLDTWAVDQGWTDQIVRRTAHQGARRSGGRYTRPDFIVIGVKKFEYTTGVVRDLVTFEVKPLGAGIDAVFEAAAQSRVATKSYLAIEVSTNAPTEDELSRFQAECQRFEVGLILFRKGGDASSWEYPVDPVRKEPDPELLEGFVKTQLSTKDQERIRKWFR